MKIPANNLRIGVAVAVILGTITWLAYSGYSSGKSYYVTIPEMNKMGDKAFHSHLRVDGFVVPGTIEHSGPHVTFVLNEFESHNALASQGHLLKVEYKGSEPPPDTFKDDAQALAEGSLGRDGVLRATILQAKCASKYASTPNGGQPGAAPGAPAGSPAPAGSAPAAPAPGAAR